MAKQDMGPRNEPDDKDLSGITTEEAMEAFKMKPDELDNIIEGIKKDLVGMSPDEAAKAAKRLGALENVQSTRDSVHYDVSLDYGSMSEDELNKRLKDIEEGEKEWDVLPEDLFKQIAIRRKESIKIELRKRKKAK